MVEQHGYDAPITVSQEDLLGRLPFAREIAQIATTAPKEWSLRIGVYGGWGTGKTSVLHLVNELVRNNGHYTAWFNPWGFSSADEMIQGLAKAAIEQLEAEGVDVPGVAKRIAKTGVRLGKRVAEPVNDAAKELAPGPVVSVGSNLGRIAGSWLNRWLGDQAEEFRAIEEALGDDKRLVVLIDDVDRADPKVLPLLLFALHDALAQGKLSFVLALDPEVVSNALADYHKGFGQGPDFLDKIIQFPRWLPKPTDGALLKLAEKDLSSFARFVPVKVLHEEFVVMPRNPRATADAHPEFLEPQTGSCAPRPGRDRLEPADDSGCHPVV